MLIILLLMLLACIVSPELLNKFGIWKTHIITENEHDEKCASTHIQSGFILIHFVMYDNYLLKDVHSVLVNFPREYAQESMMLYI